MANQIKAPINYPIIAGGKIVSGGSVLFGQPNVKPDEDNPSTLKAIYLDAALSQQAENPQGISSDGVFDQSDTGILYGPTDTVYSIVIRGANKKELSYIPEYDLSDANAAQTAQDAAAAAASSESNAIAAKDLTEALYTDFTNRYFGAYSSNPAVDDLGNPPSEGSIYFNTTSNVFYTWRSGIWVNDFPSNPNGLMVTATGTTTPRSLADTTSDNVNVENFSTIEEALNYSATNKKIVRADDNYTVTNYNQKQYADAVLVGNGSLAGAYRKHVIPINSGSDNAINAFNSSELDQLNKAKNPICVLVGDSIATYNANTKSRYGMLTASIEDELRRQFPTVQFHNRAIGGTTYKDFDGIPTAASSVEWYDNLTKDWIDYIEDLSPDCVFLSFGMNDSTSFKSSNFLSVISKLNSFAKPPSIIFCTPLVPSLTGSPSGNDTKSEQEGRDFVAGYIRTYAIKHSYACLDFNRQCTIARDGFDVIEGGMGNRKSVSMTLNMLGEQVFRSEDECYNFKWVVNIDGNLFLDSTNNYIDLTIGGGVNNSKVRLRQAGGFLRVVLYSGTDMQNVDSITDTNLSVSGTIKLNIEKRASVLSIYQTDVNLGANTDPIFTSNFIATGGLITPEIRSSPDNKVISATVDVSTPNLYMPKIIDSVLWGDGSQTTGEFGGSGWNHPSSFAAPIIYDPVLRSASFKKSVNEDASITTLYPTNAVPSSATLTSEESPFFLRYSQNVDNYYSWTINENMALNSIEMKHIFNSSATRDITYKFTLIRVDENTTPVATVLRSGTKTLNVNTDANVVVDSFFVNNNPVSLQKGDQISFQRVGSVASDNYSDLDVLEIRLKS